MTNEIDEKLAKPLGIGFDNVWTFLQEYIRPDREEGTSTPDLTFSLEHVKRIPDLDELVRRVGQNPLCVIEGCTSPTNGSALKQFVESYGIMNPEIHAIDLIDVKSIFEHHGIPMPDLSFHVADARDLSSLFGTGSVGIVAQDFLLNCAPYSTHLPIMQEAYRIMNQDSIAIVCFTDHQGPANNGLVSYREIELEYDVKFCDEAFSLKDLIPSDDEGLLQRMQEELAGKVIVNSKEDNYVLVTEEGGNFEFYRPFESFEQMFRDASLRITGIETSSGYDRNLNLCFRYRTILKKSE